MSTASCGMHRRIKSVVMIFIAAVCCAVACNADEVPPVVRTLVDAVLPPVDRTAAAEATPTPSVESLEDPATSLSIDVPLTQAALPERTMVKAENDLVTLVVRDAQLNAVLNALAQEMGLNIVSSASVSGQISITLTDVPFRDALDAILSVNGYRWVQNKNIIMVSSLDADGKLDPSVNGRHVRVFPLDFVGAADIDKTVQGLLSPVGSSFVTEVDSAEKLSHREELVVEDLPEYIARIERYIAQVDQPPAQVLIEAHVLQVSLREENRHGVDIQSVARLANANITLQNNGIANLAASPAFLLNVDGTDVDSIVEVLKGTTDAKTLASPKVLAVNGQEARIQIGESLGYLTTTTTQTSTVQDVNFLDLGVVLTVTPVVSRDGRILMTVKPEVSSGRINATTGLPDSETTEVESTVLLPSGKAMVIGGLIREENTDQEGKMPIAGDIPVLGRLFQRRNRVKDRNEIIIVVLPRIVPYGEADQSQHSQEVQRATTPLMHGPLIPVDRTQFEARLPNSDRLNRRTLKRISSFPTPPVAYSPYFVDEYDSVPVLNSPPRELVPSQDIQSVPLLPPAGGPSNPAETRLPVPSIPPASEFLPPVLETTERAQPRRIRQTSAMRESGHSKGVRRSGWSAARRP